MTGEDDRELVELLERALAPGYQLVRKLGAGGMGSVYLAREPALRRMVAVKVLSPELARDEEARARFEREAQAVAAISHPNVVSVFRVGEMENGVPFLVMQYVDGRSMADRLASEGPLDIPVARRAIAEVASALAAAHRHGIIHRDIKPANVLWDELGGRALVTDFGIAALLDHADQATPVDIDALSPAGAKLTQAGMSLGTPAYMSPEQLLAEPVSEKTDVYAVGLLGYELLTGTGPYDATTPRQLLAAHLTEEPRLLSSLRGEVDPELEQVLRSCLAKHAADRPAAAEVSERLVRGVGVLLEWPPPGLEQAAPSTRSATRTLALGAALVVLPLIMMAAFDSGSAVRRALPPPPVLFLIATGGAVAMVAGWIRLFRVFGNGRAATRAGYGWTTIAEAAVDIRGDTGAVIAGAREYATLSPAEREGIRRNRLTAGAFRLLGSMAPIAGFLAGVVLAGRLGGTTSVVIWASALLPAALLFAARVAVWQEDKHVAHARRRVERQPRPTQDRGVARAWVSAFDTVRAGQSLSTGSRARGRGVALVAGAAIAVSLALTLLVYTLTAAGVIVETMMTSGYASYAEGREDVLRLSRLRSYRLPPDPGITALRAGEALQAIAHFGSPLEPPFRAPSRPIKGPPIRIETTTTSQLAEDMRAARTRLARRRRQQLDSLARHPIVHEFRTLARARRLDAAGAAMPANVLDSAFVSYVPGLPLRTILRAASPANLAAATIAMADGRTAEAELRLRETLSVGFLLIDEGNATMDVFGGAAILDQARAAMLPFFEATGRPADARFVSPDADLRPFMEATVRAHALDPQLHYERMMALLGDTADLRAIRIDVLFGQAAFAPCADIRQVLFGVEPRHRELMARAAESLVRFPSDSAIFAHAIGAMDRPFRHRDGKRPMVQALARGVDWLIGGRRLESCVALFVQEQRR